MRRSVLLLLAVGLSVPACSAGRVPPFDQAGSTSTSATIATTTSPETSTSVASTMVTSTTRTLVVPEQLTDRETQALTIEDGEITYVLTVAVARTPAERRQGLMDVVDLGDLDGMLFVWGEPTTGSFWMKDTPLPLDIAFFAADGSWVDNFTMAVCPDGSCPDYFAAGPYQYAIEVPETGFAGLTPSATLNLNP